MKRGMFFAMIALLIMGWMTAVKQLTQIPRQFNQLVAQAREYEEKELYIRAIDVYREALEYNPDSLDVQVGIAKDYLAIGDESAFTSRCDAINEAHDYPVSVVTLLADYYIEAGRNSSAITLLEKAMKSHASEKELQSRYEKVRYTYQNLYVSADEIGQIANGTAAFVLEGSYGIMTSSGSIRIRNNSQWCGPYSSDGALAPVQQNGSFFFVNSSGYRYEVPAEDQTVEELGILTNNVAPAKINGGYGYVNSGFEPLSSFSWDGATQISGGLGAVKQGEKWALINEKYELLTDYIYEDVAVDENGFFCVNSRAFVKNGGVYQMINEKGEPVGEGGYEDAVPFVGEQPTAVRIQGSWGFADSQGELVIEPQYEQAGAFSNGLAPVETVSGWGYINQENRLVIEDEFSGAKNFYQGIAPVKDGNQWTLIELNVKNG